jgi:hypothetical protein
MTTLNIFTRIRYLPNFFGVCTLEIITTLDNMVFKIIDYNGIAMNTCSHAKIEAAFRFYSSNKVFSPSLADGDPLEHWLQFQTGNYEIRHTEFYNIQFRLLEDRYTGLLTVFNTIPLYFPFAKIVQTLVMREFGGYDFASGNTLRYDGNIQSTPKQKATKIDSVFITFHPNDKSNAICIQHFIDNFKLTAEDAGALMYPASGFY